MKKMICTLALLFSCVTSYAQETEQEIVDAITAEFMGYFEDFVARDFDGIATHFQLPALLNSQIGTSYDEIARIFEEMPIQDGYKYSTVDSLEVNKLNNVVYVINLSFRRFNASDEVIFQGTS